MTFTTMENRKQDTTCSKLSGIVQFAVLAVWLAIASSAIAGQEAIKVGIIGDQTWTNNLEQSYSVFDDAVDILRNECPDVVIHVGDLVESSEEEGDYRKRFEQAVTILDRLQKPWYLTVGDHDTNPPDLRPGSSDRSRETWFKNLYSSRVPQAKTTLYYSFDVGKYHFIALNSQETLRVDPRWGNIFRARISDQQFDWLREDLNNQRSTKAIVVFLHQPLWYNWIGWKPIHELLRQYPVAAVIAGHFHYNQDEGELDGIRYVVVGATGGSIKQGNRLAGSVHHVTVMTLEGRHASFQLLPIGSLDPLTLTPRRDMDRVQALDQTLGNIGNFERQNPLFMNGNKLVSSCLTEDPPVIRIASVGNPLEIDVRFRVELESDSQFQLTTSRFVHPCVGMPSQSECVLRAGTGIAIANLSTVSADFCSLCGQGSESFWEGQLEFKGRSLIPADYPVKFKLRASFEGEQGELALDRILETHLRVCQP